jgi:hypothetical protein
MSSHNFVTPLTFRADVVGIEREIIKTTFYKNYEK